MGDQTSSARRGRCAAGGRYDGLIEQLGGKSGAGSRLRHGNRAVLALIEAGDKVIATPVPAPTLSTPARRRSVCVAGGVRAARAAGSPACCIAAAAASSRK